MTKRLVVGTRSSKLALWQANYVADRIRERNPAIEVIIKHIITTGDRILDVPLAQIGGKGLFTKELEKELLTGEIDLAVHSLKDMPTELPEGLTLGAITERGRPVEAKVPVRDCRIGKDSMSFQNTASDRSELFEKYHSMAASSAVARVGSRFGF